MILNMYMTLMSVILAGVGNMAFTRTGLYRKYARPIDAGRCMSDGKRIFGDNKTFIGFFSMIVINSLVQLLWGLFCSITELEQHNMLYGIHENTAGFNLLAGAAFGFAYMICELPNSFIKRRLDIPAGKTEKGVTGVIFFVIDQIDSLFGVVFVLSLLMPMDIWLAVAFILLGGITHIAVNLVLYKTGVRKNL